MQLTTFVELLILILANLGNFLIGAFILSKNTKSATNRLLAFLVVALVGWTIANYLSVQATQPESIYFYVRLIFFFITIENTAFFLLMYTFPKMDIAWSRTKLIGYGLFSSLLSLFALYGHGFTSYTAQGDSISLMPQLGLFLFMGHATFSIIGGFARLDKNLRTSQGLEKSQLRFLLLASIILWVVVPITNFVLPITFQINTFAALSPVYALMFAATMGYAIVKKRLFDIQLVVARTIAYVLLLVALASIYGASVFGVSVLFLSDPSTTTSHVVFVALAVFLAFTFQPLRRFFEYLTDRVFYRDRYDSSDVINQIGKVLASELLLENITNRVLNIICRNLRLQTGQLIIFGGDQIYQAARFGSVPKIAPSYDKLSLLMEQMYVTDEQEDNQVKDLLAEYQARLSLPLKTSEELSGLLLLGNKQSGGIYTSQDIELLQVIDDELAVGIQNAKAYQEIKEFNVKLRQWVEDATQQLRESNAKLRELDEAKDEFISMASHQLRTPLTTIKGYLSMLLEGDAGKLSDRQEEFLDLAFNSSQRMVSLITDLLNVSRINTGKFTIDKEEADLAKIVEEEVKQLRRYAEDREVELNYNRPDQPVQLELDVNKTRQVIMNFVDNAIYYTPEGGWIKVELEQANGAVEFKVVDNGIGVPENEQEELFTKFYRASNAQEIRPAGTGLGLFMAKKVIKAQGGEIIFESAEGEGSTFGFRLAKSGPDQSSGSKTQAEATKEPVEKSATALHQ